MRDLLTSYTAILRTALVFATCSAGCLPAAQAAETLEQAWTIALQRDHQLAATQQKERAADYQHAAAEALRLPTVSMNAGYTRLEYQPAMQLSIPGLPFLQGVSLPFAQDAAYSAGVSVTAPLYTGGKISGGIAAARAQSEAMHANTEQARADLKYALAVSYIAVLRAQHAVTLVHSHIATISRHVSDVQALSDQGYVARHDLLATEVELASAQQLGLQAENALALASADYNRWLGRSQDSTVEIADLAADGPATDGADLPDLLNSAYAQRKELLVLDKQAQAYKNQASSVSAGNLPQIGLSAGWNKLENRYLVDDKGWWVGVVLKWNLFDGAAVRNQAAQLQATAQAVQDMQDDARERIALQVRQSWLNQKEANARMQLVEKALQQADETLALARERYSAGLAPNSEVLDAETRRLQAHTNRDNALYDRVLARIQVQHVSGRL
jgi:outer membrane protein